MLAWLQWFERCCFVDENNMNVMEGDWSVYVGVKFEA